MFVRDTAADAGKARTGPQFDAVGLQALGALYKGDENNQGRWSVMKKNWSALTRAPSLGDVRVVGKRHGLSEFQSTLLGAEVSKIITWRQAMVDLARALLEVEPYFKGGTNDPDSDKFQDLQKKLRDKVGEVAKEARAQWGDPWGIVAFHYLAGRKSPKKVRVTGNKVALNESRERSA